MTEQKNIDASKAEKIKASIEAMKGYLNSVPFSSQLGMVVTEATTKEITLRFEMQPHLIGNMTHRILHGGVIATAMDMAGGAIGVIAAYPKVPKEERMERLKRFGTIDMQVEYLKPGRGEWFEVIATVMRAGKQVCVTRMDLYNNDGDLIATASGTYLY